MDRPRRDVHRRLGTLALMIGAIGLVAGCGALKPRNFRALENPAPVVRAGAVSLGDDQPDFVAIPAWIGRLDDKDPVVRMAANESLKTRTGQDFGYVAWAEADDRKPAVTKWKAWWKAKASAKAASPVQASPQAGVVPRRRKR